MGVKKQYHEDCDPQEAARMPQRIRADIKPAARAETNSVATPNNSVSSPLGSSPNSTDDEPYEPSSPPCYLNEFKNW